MSTGDVNDHHCSGCHLSSGEGVGVCGGDKRRCKSRLLLSLFYLFSYCLSRLLLLVLMLSKAGKEMAEGATQRGKDVNISRV